MAILPPKTLKEILSLSKNLVKLSLEHVIVPKEVVQSMTVFAHSIEVLNLSMCYELEAVSVAGFLMNCQK